MVAIMLVGEVLTYVADPYDYSSKMDGYEYKVESSVSADFSIIQYTEQNQSENIYVYYDGDYASPAGTTKNEIKELQRELELRGTCASIVNSLETAELITTTSDASKSMLIFVDGGMPDTIYTGQSSDLIFTWFDNGGSVSWIGYTIGKYSCTKDSVEEIGEERYALFFSESQINDADRKEIATNADSGLGKKLCVRTSNCSYGLSKSIPDTLSLGYVSDSGYCGAAITKFHNGQLLIVGGGFGDTERSDLAQIVAAGITYGSVLVSEHSVHCHSNSKKGTVDNQPGTGVYIFCGGDYTCYGKSYSL